MNCKKNTFKIVRHPGVSFVPGTCNVHFWLINGDENIIRDRWTQFLVKNGLAADLQLELEASGQLHCYARTYVFLPLFIIENVIEYSIALGAQRDFELQEQLSLLRLDAQIYSKSYGFYYEICQFRGWVGIPLLLGRQPAFFMGVGRYGKLLSMNLDTNVSAIIAFSGSDKAYCRNLLSAHGFTVPPGAVATTASEARERAVELGFPVALKLAQGGGNSEGVILNIDDGQTCFDAANKLLGGGQVLIIERMVSGIELRLHFIRGNLFRILRSEAYMVVGDGKANLAQLLDRQFPDYFRTMMSTTHHQRRLILQLYAMGARTIDDLSKIVPESGRTVRVSAATGGNNMKKLDHSAINNQDKIALESFLTRYGAPSAGIDIILPYLGASLADGGAILEANIPCGFGYLGEEAARAADLELLDSAKRCEGFITARSRVPVELALNEEFAEGTPERLALTERFLKDNENGNITTLTLVKGWLQIITEQSASAFLVFVDEAAIIEHGMPVHLCPTVVCLEEPKLIESKYPKLYTTAVNAGGHFVQVRKVA